MLLFQRMVTLDVQNKKIGINRSKMHRNSFDINDDCQIAGISACSVARAEHLSCMGLMVREILELVRRVD